MIRITDQYFWNIIFILFYLGLLVMMGIILSTEAQKTYGELTIFDIVIISLASFRLTRLFVYDGMTKFFREQFYDAKLVKTKVILVKPEEGPRRTLSDLMNCPWCFGVWATTMIIFFYLLTPLSYFPILILALSSVATFLSLISNLVGTKTEALNKNIADSGL
jgi:hypothetical protein